MLEFVLVLISFLQQMMPKDPLLNHVAKCSLVPISMENFVCRYNVSQQRPRMMLLGGHKIFWR